MNRRLSWLAPLVILSLFIGTIVWAGGTTLTASIFRMIDSVTDSVDLGTEEVKGTLPLSKVNSSTLCKVSGGADAAMTIVTITTASPVIAMATASEFQITLTGTTNFTATGMGPGRTAQVFISPGNATRTISFPAFKFLGSTAPTTIAADKEALLYVTCKNTDAASCRATYSVQP